MSDKKFNQVCVLPGTVISEGEQEEFIITISLLFDCRFKFIESFETLPSMENGSPIPETGGRPDVLFFVHDDDIIKFAAPRFQYNIRWIEDVFANMDRLNNVYYPERLRKYCGWDATVENAEEIIQSKLN